MSTTFTLTADQMAKQALQLCGLVPLGRSPKAEQLSDARDLLSVILKSLQARGVTLTQAEPDTQTLSSGTASYTLDADTIDVEFPTTVTKSGETSEYWVEKMVYADYRVISDKTTLGTPTRAYVEKLSVCRAVFWPVPNGTYTWNFRAIKLLPDMSSGSTTTGLTQRWLGALVWRLAYWLAHANNLPAPKRLELKSMADEEERRVMGQENERGDLCLELPRDPYGGGW